MLVLLWFDLIRALCTEQIELQEGQFCFEKVILYVDCKCKKREVLNVFIGVMPDY